MNTRHNSLQKFVYGVPANMVQCLDHAILFIQSNPSLDLDVGIQDWKSGIWDDGSLWATREAVKYKLTELDYDYYDKPQAIQLQLANQVKQQVSSSADILVISSKGTETVSYTQEV